MTKASALARVTIVGAGVAGAYLGAKLSREGIDVEGIEAQDISKYHSVCAWATSVDGIRGYLRSIDLDIDGYIIREADGIYVDLGGRLYRVPTRHLATFDKPALIVDLARSFKVRYPVRVRGIPDVRSDLIVDATGVHRSVIGPAEDGADLVLPAYQLLVRYRNPPMDDFYVKPFPRYTGYLWYFPLTNGEFFVGAGDLHHGHLKQISEFLDKHPPDEVLRREGRPIRISPPGILRPLFRAAGMAVTAVGEAAGAVLPMLGEGILPSVMSAEMLFERISNASEAIDLQSYAEGLTRKFSVFGAAYRFVRKKQLDECRISDISCTADALRLALFFSSRSGRRLTGLAPTLRHAYLAVRPF